MWGPPPAASQSPGCWAGGGPVTPTSSCITPGVNPASLLLSLRHSWCHPPPFFSVPPHPRSPPHAPSLPPLCLPLPHCHSYTQQYTLHILPHSSRVTPIPNAPPTPSLSPSYPQVPPSSVLTLVSPTSHVTSPASPLPPPHTHLCPLHVPTPLQCPPHVPRQHSQTPCAYPSDTHTPGVPPIPALPPFTVTLPISSCPHHVSVPAHPPILPPPLSRYPLVSLCPPPHPCSLSSNSSSAALEARPRCSCRKRLNRATTCVHNRGDVITRSRGPPSSVPKPRPAPAPPSAPSRQAPPPRAAPSRCPPSSPLRFAPLPAHIGNWEGSFPAQTYAAMALFRCIPETTWAPS